LKIVIDRYLEAILRATQLGGKSFAGHPSPVEIFREPSSRKPLTAERAKNLANIAK
jgi:hypothetical protein